jgi:hypothetical protein
MNLTIHLTPGDQARNPYYYVPFEVPAGSTRIDVTMRYPQAEDCVVDLGRVLKPEVETVVEGRDRLLEEVYFEPGHRAAEGRTQHFRSGPQIIQILSDEAEAVTYAMTSLLQPDGSASIMVSGFNFWAFRRDAGRWRITRRTHRKLGDGDVLDLFRPLIARTIAGLG